MRDNILASNKVLYKGQPIAAIAATSPHIAEEAWSLLDEEGFVINQQFPKGKKSDVGFLICVDLFNPVPPEWRLRHVPSQSAIHMLFS